MKHRRDDPYRVYDLSNMIHVKNHYRMTSYKYIPLKEIFIKMINSWQAIDLEQFFGKTEDLLKIIWQSKAATF